MLSKLVLGGLLCLVSVTMNALPDPRKAHHERDNQLINAVALARAGDTDKALHLLQALHAEYPNETTIRNDYAVVAHWHGSGTLTLSLLESADRAELPAYVVKAFAASARNAHQWSLAANLYEELTRRPNSKVEGLRGQLLVQADAGQFEQGYALLEALPVGLGPSSPGYAGLQMACGYLHERAQSYLQALNCYNEGLRHHPGHGELRHRRAIVASALGAASVAAMELTRSPELFNDAERERIQLDAAAMRIRWVDLYSEATQLDHAAEALQQYERLGASVVSNRDALSFDRFVALATAYRMLEAQQAFEALVVAHGGEEKLPVYVLNYAGRVHLYLEQPRVAQRLFDLAFQAGGENLSSGQRFSLQMGLFNALADMGEYEALQKLVEEMVQQEAPWHRPTEQTWIANERFASAAEVSAVAHAYRDEYDSALEQIDAMLSIAPANGSLRLSRAAISRWRGWYSKSAQDVAQVAVTGEYKLRTIVDRGQLSLDTQAYDQVAPALIEAKELHALDKAVVDLEKRWRLHERSEFVTEGRFGHSDGSRVGNRYYAIDSHLYSSPLATHYRLFGHGVSRFASFDEGDGRDSRLGAGLGYRVPGLTVRGEINSGFEQYKGSGVSLRADWRFSDYWFMSAEGAINSASMPLRGLRVGISADEVNSTFGYRWHEARQAQVTVGAMRMDDGNRRELISAGYRQRVFSTPRQNITALLGFYASRNSLADTVYFNPQSDRDVSAEALHEWRIFRDYDRSLIQRVGLKTGSYYQDGFGSNTWWTARWEQQWQLNAATYLGYGVILGRRHYDGDAEREINYFFNLGRRL
jgi:poly-beta-1,6 N-acetyl-D-glucosamine export porin PgaA